MDATENELRTKIEDMISSLDKQHLRRIRKESFLCAARCCDDKGDHEALNGCVQNCQQSVQVAEDSISSELSSFQNRLQRCAAVCRDSVQDQLGGNHQPDDATLQKLQNTVDTCVNKCLNTSISSLSPMQKNLEAKLAKLR